ncbi:MAG: hypothetical protein DMG57_10915 [Acidobacteria bacterium]|nr:MAG: hypothetical protein DMG57_10915 [Acidobacteriota bacterium]
MQSFSLSGTRTTGKAIVVSENGLSELEIVPGAAGSVAVVVRDQEGKAAPSAHLICIGRDDSSGEVVAICGPAVTDQQGKFELKYLLPGEVHLAALTEFDPESADLRSLREVLSHSQVGRVEENKKRVVDLELSSKSN